MTIIRYILIIIAFFSIGTFDVVAVWQNPFGTTSGTYVDKEEYEPLHQVYKVQQKNFIELPNFLLSVGSQPGFLQPSGSGSGSSGGSSSSNSSSGSSVFTIFNPLLSLVAGDYFSTLFSNFPFGNQTYKAPEAFYADSVYKSAGNISTKSHYNKQTNIPGVPQDGIQIPGFIRSELALYGTPGTAQQRDALYLEGGTDTTLPPFSIENDMASIVLKQPNSAEFISAGYSLPPLNAVIPQSLRFGVEYGNDFASIRLGSLAVNKVHLGGNKTANQYGSITPAYNNFIGNFDTYPETANTSSGWLIDGNLSTSAPSNSYYSNIGYGNYCYLQNPQFGGKCPEGFYLSKYDGRKESICRSINPSANPQAVSVNDEFKGNPTPANLTSYYANPPKTNCLQTPPLSLCENGIDDDGDGLVDYGNSGSNDPGCESVDDMTEYNIPVTPQIDPNRFVVGQLDGPYPLPWCKLRGTLVSADQKFAAFYDDSNPFTFLSPFPSPWPVTGNPTSYYNNFMQINGSNGILYQVPFSSGGVTSFDVNTDDLVIKTARYGTWLGNSNQLHELGPLVPGWYFVNRTNKMVKIVPPLIINTKTCN